MKISMSEKYDPYEWRKCKQRQHTHLDSESYVNCVIGGSMLPFAVKLKPTFKG
jgi:hypothetical protein